MFKHTLFRMMLPVLAVVLLNPMIQVEASERLNRILTAKALKVCIWPDYFTITYRNPRTQTLEGIDIDMSQALATHLGVTLTYVESSFAALAENLRNGQCDIAMHGVGVRDSRKPHMAFSKPYLASGIYAVGTKENNHIKAWDDIDRPGNVAVVQKGTYMEPVIKAAFTQAEVTVVDSFKAREQEVLSGRADVFMTDYPYGKRMANLTEWAVLLAPKQPLAKTFYAYAVPKDEVEWLAEVDRFLATMKANGQLKAFAAKNGLSEIVVLE